jgi:polyisoprenoid-binding protein YceI
MQEAMRMTNAPRILYRATEMVAKAPVPDAGSPVKFDTKGELAVAGVTNKIDMEVTMERMDNDMLKFTGSKALKMTDFKITPPSPKLSGGFIKTGDEVTVKFEWVLGMKK